MSSKSTLIRTILILGELILIGLSFGEKAYAQVSNGPWSLPVNLSNSGGTTDPAMVIDTDGAMHVIWQDPYRGTVYTGFDGTQWSPPVALMLPFSSTITEAQPGGQATTGVVPTFVADPSGLVHAFWTDTEYQLFHSYVPAARFGDPGAWSGSVQLAESVVDFDAIVDDQGRIHLAYVRNLESTEFPAGIYYRVTNDRGLSWSSPTPVYLSPYYRASTNTEANVDLESQAGADEEALYLSWDNRLRKQVYFAGSSDGGESWSEPELVDSSTEENPSARPLNIRSAVYQGGLLRLWQDGDPNTACVQYYHMSTDGGSTWGERLEMLDEISGCPQDIYFFNQGGLLVMMATIQGQVYLLAWDGSQWSNPQLQRDLLGFEDLTTFDQVIFDCRRPAQNVSGDLVVVGCDTGTGGDIWLTQRAIGDVSQWFPPPSAWTAPEEITTADTPITNPILLSDSQERLHAFWVQPETSTTTGSASSPTRDAIYYSRKDSDQWTRPVVVLQSPSGMTRQPAAAIDASDNLYVVWSGGETGEIYFSRATGSRANIPAEWGQPTPLPTVRQSGNSPDIQVDVDGMIHVLYAIPLNENRGIYFTSSDDGGSTWEEPILAFDAVQESWEMVDQPHITVSGEGIYNVIWSKLSLPGSSASQGVYASRSIDGGITWTEPEVVSERPIIWSDQIAVVGDTIYRAWVEAGIDGDIFQSQLSTDQGANWSLPASISLIGTVYGSPALAKDQAGQLYLVQAVKDGSQEVTILNWRWDGTQWRVEESLELPNLDSLTLKAASIAVSSRGRLSLIYSGIVEDPLLKLITNYIDTSSRLVEVPGVVPTTQPAATLQPTITLEPTITVQPTLTPLINQLNTPSDIQGSSNSFVNNSWAGLAFGAILAGLVAVLVFAIRAVGVWNK